MRRACVGLAGERRNRTEPDRRLSGRSVHSRSRRTSDYQDGKDAVRLRQTSPVPRDGSQSAALLLYARRPRSFVWTVQEVHSPRALRYVTLLLSYSYLLIVVFVIGVCSGHSPAADNAPVFSARSVSAR